MAGFGGYFKGEKKKAKKGKEVKGNAYSSAPTYIMPEIVSKKRPA